MRLTSLLFTAILSAAPAWAQGTGTSSVVDSQPSPVSSQASSVSNPASSVSSPASSVSSPASSVGSQASSVGSQPSSGDNQAAEPLNLPVSLDKIKEALEQKPVLSLRTVDERPTFRVQVFERQRIDELLATLNFKAGPTPAGGVYWDEIQRQMFPSVDNPRRQPYTAFGPGELLTILIENVAGRYLGGKALNAVSTAERAHAEAAAKQEVRQAIQSYCAAQPDGGAGIQICAASSSIR